MKIRAYKYIIGIALNWMVAQGSSHSATLGTTDAGEQSVAARALADQRTATPLRRFRSFNLQGDYLAAGVGMRDRGFGTISISTIPSDSTITAAYLYWDILANSQVPDFAQGRLNNELIAGTFVGVGEDPCWNNLFNFAFRADVKSLVTGNGVYSLSGFASGTVDGRDPWAPPGGVPPMVEGASLVIVYENATKPQTQILIYDGSVETRADVVTLSIDGFTAPSPVTRAQTTFIGADGQSAEEPGSSFNGNFLPSVRWDGNDPQAGPRFSNGNLWDTMTVDVTTFVPPGSSTATATVQGSPDCLVWVAQVFSIVTPSEPKLEVLDPNNLDTTSPRLLTSAGRITTDVETLSGAKEAWPLTGVVADGVTELLLRIEVNDATAQVTFSLPGGLGDGGLKAIGSEGPLAASLPVSVQSVGGKRWAFAVYIAPKNFTPAPTTQADRDIRLVAQVGDSSRPEKDLKLKRPPVILVHGVWSTDRAWKGLEDYLVNQGYLADPLFNSDLARNVILRVNYGGQTRCPIEKATGPFDPNPVGNDEDDQKVILALVDKTESALKHFRSKGVAVTQVDVVGHSMGGLVARSRVKAMFTPELYYRPKNFNRGEFHKLITVGTPHRGTPLADYIVRYRSKLLMTDDCPAEPAAGSPVSACCGSETLEAWMRQNTRLGPIGPAIYGFQTASTALKNIGATAVPSHAIVGIAPDCTGAPILSRCTLVEWYLNNTLDNLCDASARTTVGDLLGGNGNHDTIVPTSSQKGGLSGAAITEIDQLVHAGGGVAVGVETDSREVWQNVIGLLRAPVDGGAFDHFTALVTQDTSRPWPGCPAPTEPFVVAANVISAQANAQLGSEMTITPLPGTIVRPGQTIQITFNVTPSGLRTNGVFFSVGEELFFTEGSSPFILSYTLPTNQAGHLGIFADSIYRWTNTYVLVQPSDPPLSLTVSPETVDFGYFGVPRALRVLGQYANGLELDLTSADAGTTYATLSGGNSVVSVSSNGVVEAKGEGQDTILVRNSEKPAFVIVIVRITNRAPVFDPLNDLTLTAGELRELNVRVNDPEGNAVKLSGAVLPDFAQLVDNGDASGLLRLNPGVNDVGTHQVALVAVDDGDPNLGASRTIAITVLPAADLAIQKVALPEIVRPGSNVTYTLHVTNIGPASAEGVTVSDMLPSGVSFISGSTGCGEAGGVVTCNLGTMSNGSSASVTIVVTATTAGILTNTATVSSAGIDPVSENNSDSATTAVVSSPCASVEAIIVSVNGANLDGKNKRPLIATLQAACSSFDRINAISGANQLHAFQNQVRAQISPLNPALAEQWIRAAQEIIDSVGGLQVKPRAQRTNGGTKISFAGVFGQQYALQASTNLIDWVILGAANDTGNGQFELEDNTNIPYRFYRAVVP